MDIDFGPYGYQYTEDLCLAIERMTAYAVDRNPNAFQYRNLNLRYALERHLYIQGINSKELFNLYLIKNKINWSIPDERKALPWESKLVEFFLTDKPLYLKPSTLRWEILQFARRVYVSVRNFSRSWRKLSQKPKYKNIFIQINNVKFVSYLSPITAKLTKGSYAYLSCLDQQLQEDLIQTAQPTIRYAKQNISLQTLFPPRELTEFAELLYDSNKILAALSDLRPRVVLVVEGNAPQNVITAEVCKHLEIPCYCIQQGWSPYIHSGFRNMAYTEMFVWGKPFAEMLQPYNQKQKFRVTGSHSVQSMKQNDAIINDQLFPIERRFSFFLQAPCALLGLESFNSFLNLIYEIAKNHINIEFIVREHPGYPLSNEWKQRLKVLKNISFSDLKHEKVAALIIKSELIISIFSTVILEALALNVPALICSVGAMSKYSPDLASCGAALEVNSLGEARELIERIIQSPEYLKTSLPNMTKVSEYYFQSKDTINEITGVLEENI